MALPTSPDRDEIQTMLPPPCRRIWIRGAFTELHLSLIRDLHKRLAQRADFRDARRRDWRTASDESIIASRESVRRVLLPPRLPPPPDRPKVIRRNQADENRHRSPVEQRFKQGFDQLPSRHGDGKYEENRRQCRPADRLERSPTVWAVQGSSIRQPQSLPARECGSPWEPLSTLRTGAHPIYSSRRAVHTLAGFVSEDLNHRIGGSRHSPSWRSG